MNLTAEEILQSYGLGSRNPTVEDMLAHYGVKRRSGRYPWGSGEEPYQHSGDFISRVNELKAKGMSEKEIAENMHMSTTDLRMQIRVANHERRALEVDRARSLREDGKSLQEIAEIMGYKNDSSIRSLLNEGTAARKDRARQTAEKLKEELEEKGMLDVGAGVEVSLGVTQQTLKEALFILETEGYKHFGVGMQQVTNPKQQTSVEIIAKSDDDIIDLQRQVYKGPSIVQSVDNYHSEDGGKTFRKLEIPASISSDRVAIRYPEQGGNDKDGVIELRRGVKDLDLGNDHYAQVRILVDGDHYLKGMAMYAEDGTLPDGVDVMFNTSKPSSKSKMQVLKAVEEGADPRNPFGAAIKANGQSFYDDPNGRFVDPITGKKQSLSAINKLKEEGDWDDMSRTISAQFLSKQPKALIKSQLALTYQDYDSEFQEIMSLTNPTIKKKLLLDFADTCDGAAVHMKAAAFPRQSTKVILPVTALKDTEVFAPTYKNGETVALIRYPHGGTFEIPILTVNNKNKSALNILGTDIQDAIGINPRVAERLSGADFDGDFVIVIPTSKRVKIKSTDPLDGLKGFDPKIEYSTEGKTGVRLMSEKEKQKQMGIVSNLITDMTLKGANENEIARAVRHSMVVIDAVKHKLDYKQSEKDNGIAELQEKYQGYFDERKGKQVGGATTLISRKKQEIDVPERRGSRMINPETGEVSYKTSGRTYIDKKTGEVRQATSKEKLILATPDVRTLSSGTEKEDLYADYSNKMKALANEARKAYKGTGNLKYDASAAKTYSREVDALTARLNAAIKNAPRERRAQAIALSEVNAKLQANPELRNDKKEVKKMRHQAQDRARESVGSGGRDDTKIHITDKEWEAIQAGAISDSKLTKILKYADTEDVRKKATPKATTTVTPAKAGKIAAYRASGYTIAEIAEALGMSTSTVSKYLKEH